MINNTNTPFLLCLIYLVFSKYKCYLVDCKYGNVRSETALWAPPQLHKVLPLWEKAAATWRFNHLPCPVWNGLYSIGSRLQTFRCVTVVLFLVPLVQLLSSQASSFGLLPTLLANRHYTIVRKPMTSYWGSWWEAMKTEGEDCRKRCSGGSEAKKTLEVCLWLVFWEINGPPCTKMANGLHDESLALLDSSVLHRHCPLATLRCSSVPASEE